MITFGDALTVHFNGEEVRVVHYANCHTDGDAVVIFAKSNVAHLGDLFFNGLFPFVDQASGGSVRGLEHAIGELIANLPEGAAIIPGHGPVAKLDDLKTYRAMLVDCLAVVSKAVAEGKTAKDIAAAKLLAKYDSWSWQFISTDKWIETLVSEVSAQAKR
jgi:glyoxylase-like metal-dependent hydrolase (beta-lactamase superfamily II)